MSNELEGREVREKLADEMTAMAKLLREWDAWELDRGPAPKAYHAKEAAALFDEAVSALRQPAGVSEEEIEASIRSALLNPSEVKCGLSSPFATIAARAVLALLNRPQTSEVKSSIADEYDPTGGLNPSFNWDGDK